MGLTWRRPSLTSWDFWAFHHSHQDLAVEIAYGAALQAAAVSSGGSGAPEPCRWTSGPSWRRGRG
jgi:hypothetical protein